MTCPTCKAGVKAGMYDTHQCIPRAKSIRALRMSYRLHHVIHQLLCESPESVVEIPTRGTVSNIHNIIMLHYATGSMPPDLLEMVVLL